MLSSPDFLCLMIPCTVLNRQKTVIFLRNQSPTQYMIHSNSYIRLETGRISSPISIHYVFFLNKYYNMLYC